jgi:serine/threonine protein kinase
MNPEEEIFEHAAALPAEERAAYLDKACAGQPEQRARIDALLRSHEVTGFMEDHTAVVGGQPLTEQCGERIGRYRLLQQIGEGGFGVVWMAEQVEPVTRRVALKIIKAGMDTREVIARFEAERQALAMMDHPNIAKVFDAGTTGESASQPSTLISQLNPGRPYFVMELVKGIPITKFCDEQQLNTRQRLELFADVCSAINHAHQKGVIHRDIKPSNVMVTLHCDKPVVKVIDFGIAKATEGRLTDKTLFTRFEQFVGTPAYMSPEQSALGGLDVDTRSDIYALGVLLYELLTGQPPFDAKSLLSAGYDEMRRIIREVEPPKPSTRVKELLTAATVSGLSANSKIAPPQSKIAPDLDWIVMKAIEKDRTRRYETANGLGLDIQRFLSDEPVSAGPPSTFYRFRKFVRRNKPALRAVVAVTVLLSLATILSTWYTTAIAVILLATASVSTWFAAKAIQAGKHANRKTADELLAREDAEALSTLVGDLFESANPARDGPFVTVATILERSADALDAAQSIHPARRAKLHETLGKTLFGLGQFQPAASLLERAWDGFQRCFGREHPNTLGAMHRTANAYHAAGRLDDALRLREQVLPLRRAVLGPEHPDTLWAMHTLANSLHGLGQWEEALVVRHGDNAGC